MSIVRALARPLLAAPFVTTGIDAVLHPMNRAERARPLVDRLAPMAGLPADPDLAVRGTGALMAGAGLLLATGRAPRLAAMVLAAVALPSTYLDHPFWEQPDAQRRRDERTIFLRNLGLVGGALLAAVDTEGRPSLAWRGRRAVRRAERGTQKALSRAERGGERALARTEDALSRAERNTTRALARVAGTGS